MCVALSSCFYFHYFSDKTTFNMLNVIHWRRTSVSTNEGNSFREHAQWCCCIYHWGCLVRGNIFTFFLFLVKMNTSWGSSGRKCNIRCGLLLLHHSVALQSVLVYTGRGVVHIRPWLGLACCHIWLCSAVVNSINGTFYKAGCVKSFSCSTALLDTTCANQ